MQYEFESTWDVQGFTLVLVAIFPGDGNPPELQASIDGVRVKRVPKELRADTRTAFGHFSMQLQKEQRTDASGIRIGALARLLSVDLIAP